MYIDEGTNKLIQIKKNVTSKRTKDALQLLGIIILLIGN